MRRGLLALGLVVGSLQFQPPVQTQGGIISDPVNVPGIPRPVRVIRGRFTSSVTLDSQFYYVLRGTVFFERGADLTIPAGTRIVGEFATLGTLVISKGARIFANGTAANPIVMTSDQPPGQRSSANWGGLIINGQAPLNVPGGVALGEGDTGEYGGDDPNDNSGVLRYLRVEWAGIEFSPENELNGIAFQGVGRGTTVDYIQVKYNEDDGVEFFGGTVDAKHLVLTAEGDDTLDWTQGWTGRVQFVIGHQNGAKADNGIEADNNANNHDLTPRSAPVIFNMTMLGDPDSNEGGESDDGIEIRVGSAATLRNFIVMGFKENGIDVTDNSTVAQANSGALSLRNGIFFQNGLLAGTATFDSTSRGIPSIVSEPTVLVADPGLVDPFNLVNPNFRPASTASLAMTHAPAVPPNDGFFEIAPFIGALSSDPALDWTQGWTDYTPN
jgi:hypothetical protein